jgi:OmpA-OmpF porin, OOP family
MMKLSRITMKFIAVWAAFTWTTGLFSSIASAQTTSETLTKRIETTAQRIAPVRAKVQSVQQRYAIEKAQCWLDFAKHEALRNNPSPTPELVHQKAQQLLSALESGATINEPALDSNLTANDVRMRNDLWTQLEIIKSSNQFSCAAQAVACGEVMLVQAAHAHDRIDWRYAQPYFGMAEDAVRAAKRLASACTVSP